MVKSKEYRRVLFSPEVLLKARERIEAYLDKEEKDALSLTLHITLPSGDSWRHDTQEEFLADYRVKPWPSLANYRVWWGQSGGLDVYFYGSPVYSTVTVTAKSRPDVEAIFEIFENNVHSCTLPPEEKEEEQKSKLRIFIGHGRSEQWKELKDHLHDKHDYEVEAYEVGARAGHAIRDILQDMMSRSSVAILVMTGEDKDEDGNLRARQNVIHELGLFQGHLGFSRAIVLLEQDTEEFSNIHGINQIRFGKDNIKETFGEVLATLKREFEN